MKALNKFMCIGNLGGKPEMRFTPTGRSVTSGSVAMNREWRDVQGNKATETEWVNWEAWGKAGEIIKQYAAKGQKMYFEGRIKTDKYEKDGVTHHRTKLVVQEFMFLGGPQSGERVEADEPEADETPAEVPAEEEIAF